MKKIFFPERKDWDSILKRPAINNESLVHSVRSVMDAVRSEGDVAVKRFTEKFDGTVLESNLVRDAEIQEALLLVSDQLKSSIQQAADNVRVFHEAQRVAVEVIETMPGVKCWRKNVGIEKVGLYIPGGSAPLFSTILMLGIPASIAGCKEVVLCSPPGRDGKLHPAILYTAQLVGISKIYKVGGVQAIAAMAYGTETIPQVYKIFGPGNQYVTCAKQLLQQEGIAIDMPAGPSEVCVLADETAVPEFVAADMLSQAEHGPDSQVLLVSISSKLIEEVEQALLKQLEDLPRKDIAQKALENSNIVLVKDIDEAIEMVNAYAAEHLIISCKDDEQIAEQIVNAGSVFLGNYSPESVGDYASGTNHTLPTNGYAKAYSGVSLDSFVKKITYQKLTQEGIQNIAPIVMTMAEAEGLQAHSNAAGIRISPPGKS